MTAPLPPGSPCPHCARPLHGVVAYCPFCGQATGWLSASPAAAAAAAAPRPPAQPAAAVPLDGAAPLAGAPAAVSTSAAPPAPSAPAPDSAVPAAPPVAGPVPAPPPARVVRARRTPWVLLALASVGLGSYFALRATVESPCSQALSASARQLGAGDAAGARSQAVAARVACEGNKRERARELQAEADKVLAAQAHCERTLRGADTSLSEARLRSARAALDGLDTACAQSAAATGLRQRLDQAAAEAEASADSARTQLALANLPGAQAAIDRLQSLNREHPDLAALRTDLRNALAAQRQAATPPPAPVPAPAPVIPAPAPRVATPASPPPTRPAPAQAELVRTLLRDAETALAQSRFDAARTYVDSARRIDPANAQAAALLQRIRQRELQVLQQETVIR